MAAFDEIIMSRNSIIYMELEKPTSMLNTAHHSTGLWVR
jgi:hypothetical protein